MPQNKQELEVWMRGPIAGVPDLLQPAAHALLQAQEELHRYMADFPSEKLWERPAHVASVGFHLQHIAGVLDRMATYARGEVLSQLQLDYLAAEGKENTVLDKALLLAQLDKEIARFLELLRLTDMGQLTAKRGIGRKQIPNTMIGLLFHAAEHTQRHVGQLLVTSRFIAQL